MEKMLIDKIIDYLDYLRNSLHLQVTFCNANGDFDEYIHLLQPYNSHQNGYCRHVKTCDAAYRICVAKQRQLLNDYSQEAFYGCCHAGVEEYVFPIRANDTAVGFLSVSGYRGKLPQSRLKMERACKRYSLATEVASRQYEKELIADIPPMERVAPVLFPLCAMFELLYLQTHKSETKKESPALSLYAQIVNYLCYHYQESVPLKTLSRELNYSISYIRQLFRQKTGQSIAEYLNGLRIKRAKELLRTTSLRVSDIAERLGFCNSNYFSCVFKKLVGIKPLEYRKRAISLHESSVLREFNSLI